MSGTRWLWVTLFVMSLSATVEASSRLPKSPISPKISVAVSESDEYGLAEDVQRVTYALVTTIQDKLEESSKIHSERIAAETRRSMTRETWALTSYRYLITSELRRLPQDYLSVKVRLLAIRKGSLEPIFSPPELRLPADLTLAFLVPWYEHFSLKVRDLIEGNPSQPSIYAYCFNATGEQLVSLKAQLPSRLADLLKLSALSRHYRIMGFTDSQEAVSVCDHWFKPSSLSLYDYVIAGDISPGELPKEAVVDVVVWMGDRRVEIGTVSNANNPKTLASKLTLLILRSWNSISHP